MKALSLWQPHAQAIALGLELWETWNLGDHYTPAGQQDFCPEHAKLVRA